MSNHNKKQYISYTIMNGVYRPNQKQDIIPKLPAGYYDVLYDDQNDQLYFQGIDLNHDALIDLPDAAYNRVVSELERFLLPETKKAFKDYGYLYKRSSLLHGVPGTGKTCIVNRIANKVVEEGGVVLFNPHPRLIGKAFEAIRTTQPEALIVVIFEELDELMERHEDALLYALDGQVQQENVVYLSTTNHIDKIPERIKRPGRFSSVIEVKFPGEDSRRHFLSQKLINPTSEEVEHWVTETAGLSIDELSACIKDVKCLGYDLKETVERLLGNDRLVALADDSEEQNLPQPQPVDRSMMAMPLQIDMRGMVEENVMKAKVNKIKNGGK